MEKNDKNMKKIELKKNNKKMTKFYEFNKKKVAIRKNWWSWKKLNIERF